jgi:hypothetical protein
LSKVRDVLKPVTHRVEALKMAILVSIAVGGLLIMYSLDGAIISLSSPDRASSHHTLARGTHGAVGICLFVLSIAGLGMAAVRAGQKHQALFAARPTLVIPILWSTWSPPAGRSRLLALGVMRH